MKIYYDNYLDAFIAGKLKEENSVARAAHKSSGKLSASILGDPIQWQVLKVLGIKQAEPDTAALRRFERGRNVEDWFLSKIGAEGRQTELEYRNVVGMADAVVETDGWDTPVGIIPLEIKSVADTKFDSITSYGPKREHVLQACLYALAMKTKHFAVAYISTGDYRIATAVYHVDAVGDKVDAIIDRFQYALEKQHVPVFVPEQPWQKLMVYNKYPDWANLTEEELCQKEKGLWKNDKTSTSESSKGGCSSTIEIKLPRKASQK